MGAQGQGAWDSAQQRAQTRAPLAVSCGLGPACAPGSWHFNELTIIWADLDFIFSSSTNGLGWPLFYITLISGACVGYFFFSSSTQGLATLIFKNI